MQLDKYLAELNKIELLEYQEEQELWQAYKECGSQQARKKLIESYQPLVFKAAAPFRSLDNLMDVLQEGTVGLIEAVEGFDYARGVAFSLFASYRIKGRMYNFLKKEGRADVACLESGGSEQFSPLEVAEVAEQMNLSTSYIYRLQKSGVRRVRGMLSRFMHNWK